MWRTGGGALCGSSPHPCRECWRLRCWWVLQGVCAAARCVRMGGVQRIICSCPQRRMRGDGGGERPIATRTGALLAVTLVRVLALVWRHVPAVRIAPCGGSSMSGSAAWDLRVCGTRSCTQTELSGHEVGTVPPVLCAARLGPTLAASMHAANIQRRHGCTLAVAAATSLAAAAQRARVS